MLIDTKLITLLMFCQNNYITVSFGATSKNINGTYNRFTKTINIDWALNVEKRYTVFLHEIGHWYLWEFTKQTHTEKEADEKGLHIAQLLDLEETNE